MDCGLDGITFKEPSLCRPERAAECDISNIVNRFMRTGELPQMVQRPTIDTTDGLPSSYEEMMQTTTAVRQRFDALPLEERNKYNNDPLAWIESLGKDADPPATPAEPPATPTEPPATPAEPPATPTEA